ncbi:CLUMA_CG003729, isoform A [Clunio marinus]|uniref:NTF2-related export protein n=1 Tax=Clunio marinus TaxID=568069 RepID=A0A1J1HPW1_9DIPT|nr:CLUMA_CG003729, isoform A [Clunio marinus]
MAANMSEELKERINEAARAADEFIKHIYYDHVDKKKPTLNKLYMDNGLLVYNGNGFNGKDNIAKFIIEMPSTKHDLTTIDAQPILDSSAGKTILIQVSGTVKIAGKRSRAFQQTFVLTADNNAKWKIVTDTFRLQDGICGEIDLN